MTTQAVPMLGVRPAADEAVEARYGQQLALCYQCKRCTAGCPVADIMDIRPHQVVRLARLGATERLLKSQAIWTCVGCYTCTTRCPQGVPVTELIYHLKGLALKRRMVSKKAGVPAFLSAFSRTVEGSGRNGEVPMLVRYFLATNPLAALKQFSEGLTFLRQGRLPLRGEKVRGRRSVQAILHKARSMEQES